MDCSHCAAATLETANFCSQCGARLVEVGGSVHDTCQAGASLATGAPTAFAANESVAAERFQMALEALHMVMWDWNLAAGTLTYLNSFQELAGVNQPVKVFKGDEALGLVAEEDHAVVHAAGERAIKHGEEFYCEFRSPRLQPDGATRWYASRGQFARNSPHNILGVTWEITDRVLAERALRAGEAEARKLSMVASRTSNGVVLTDAQGRIEWVNEGFTRITGYTLDEVRGHKPGSFLQGPASDREVCRAMRAAVHQGQSFNVELINYRKSGHPYWVAIEAKPIYDAAGRLTQFMAIESDITVHKRDAASLNELNEQLEQRVLERTAELLKLNDALRVQMAEREQAEASLRVSEQRFREIAETIHEVFWIASPDSNQIIYVSPGYERVWGRRCQSVYDDPESFFNAIHPDDAERRRAARTLQQLGKPFDAEYRIVQPSGDDRWVWDRGFPVHDAAGAISHYIGVAQDITERKQIESTLGSNNQVLLAMTEAVSFVDAVGRIEFTNRALDTMFGYDAGELIGQPVTILNAYSAEENQRVAADVMRSVGNHGAWSGEFHNRRKDGSEFWTVAHISKFVIDGVTRFVSVQRDITERRQTDDQLAKLHEQLAHAARLGTLGEMAAGLAHELNQPLAALRLYAGAAKNFGAEAASPELYDCLRRIDEQAARAGEIIRRMRTFAGRAPSRREPAELRQLVRDVLAILDNELHHARIETIFHFDRSHAVVTVDRIQIQQVLVNLIRNAIEAMRENGEKTNSLAISVAVANDHAQLSVTDTGCGVDKSIVGKLFQPFQTTKTTGLGLGLSICRSLIEAHQGAISFNSQAGLGTTFVITLPLSAEAGR